MKNKGRLIDISLIAGAIFLGGYLIASEGRPSKSELDARRNNLLPAFLQQDVQKITMVSASAGTDVVLRKDSHSDDLGRFFLGNEGSLPADPATLGELLRTLSFATFLRSWETETDAPIETYGFQKPQLELRVDAGPRSYRVLIGKIAPSPPDSLYAQVTAKNVKRRIGVVDAELLTRLARGEQEFRGSQLFPYSRSRTSLLSISSNKGRLTLRSDGSGFLVEGTMKEAPPRRANRELSDLIFFQLARGRIDTFLDESENEGSKKTNTDFLTVSLESPDGPPVQVRLGGPCPGDPSSILALRSKPDRLFGCVTRSIMAALRSSTRDLEDRSAVALNSDEIDHVLIRQKESSLDLIRDEEGFRLLSPAPGRVSRKAADEFLDVLSRAQLEDLGLDIPALSEPWGTVMIKGQSPITYNPTAPQDRESEGNREFSLDLYRDPNGTDAVLVHRLDDKAWFRVPPSLAWSFSADATWAKSRKLSDWKEDDIEWVSLSFPGDNDPAERLTRKGADFLLEAQRKLSKADSHLARLLLDELAHLEARRFVSPSPERPEEGLLLVEWSLQEREKKRLWLGRRTRGGYLAWASFTDGAFVLPLGTKVLFETPLTDRIPATLIPQDILDLELKLDGREYRFTRQGSELRAAGGLASLGMVKPLKEALGGLEVVSGVPKRKGTSFPRGVPRLTLKGSRRADESAEEEFTIHFGQALSWHGQAVVLTWLEGASTDYFVSQGSLASLFELL